MGESLILREEYLMLALRIHEVSRMSNMCLLSIVYKYVLVYVYYRIQLKSY